MVKINKKKKKRRNTHNQKTGSNFGVISLPGKYGEIPAAAVPDTVMFKNYEDLHSLASPIPSNNFPCIFDYGWQKPKPPFTAGLSHHHLCSLKN